MGRPTKMTEDVIGKLEKGFAYGFNVSEACDYAGINRDTYYEWLNKKQEFSDRMARAQTDLQRKAKINLAGVINSGDIEQSKYYLERKCKDEFSAKQSLDLGGNVGIEIKLPDGIDEWAE